MIPQSPVSLRVCPHPPQLEHHTWHAKRRAIHSLSSDLAEAVFLVQIHGLHHGFQIRGDAFFGCLLKAPFKD